MESAGTGALGEVTASTPYLDRISISGHVPQPGSDAPWKKLLIQPISVPNLSHTGIKCAFSSSDKDLLRPDGSISTELRSSVKAGVRNLPRVHSKDVRSRDEQKNVDDLVANSSSLLTSSINDGEMGLIEAPESVPYSSRSIRSAYSTSQFFENSPVGFNDANHSGMDSLDQRLVVRRKQKSKKKQAYTGLSNKPHAIYTYRSAIKAMMNQV